MTMRYIPRPKPISVKGINIKIDKVDADGNPVKDERGEVLKEEKLFELEFTSYLLDMLFSDPVWSEGSNSAANASLQLKHAMEDKVENLLPDWTHLPVTEEEHETLSRRARESKRQFDGPFAPLNRKISRFHYAITGAPATKPPGMKSFPEDEPKEPESKALEAPKAEESTP